MATIGFDLDLTLLDARPGIAGTCRALSEHTGVPVDADAFVGMIGLPLATQLSHFFPAGEVESAVRRYRELYAQYAYASARLLPGAAAAVAAAHDLGLTVVVVTSKLAALAARHLAELKLAVDDVIGDRFGAGKVSAITQAGIEVYVGDHPADMRAAGAAGAIAAGVATGGHGRQDLAAAGGDPVFDTLHEFPAWLTESRRSEPRPATG